MDSPLGVNAIAVKYNCSPELVRIWAKKNGVPCERDFTSHKAYRFFPEHEIRFAAREHKRGRWIYKKLCVIQYPLHRKPPVIRLFRDIPQAFAYTLSNGAISRKYRSVNPRFKHFLKTVSPQEAEILTGYITSPDFNDTLFVWACDRGQPFRFFALKNIPREELVREFFSYKQADVLFIDQKYGENDGEFCDRIYSLVRSYGKPDMKQIKEAILPPAGGL